MKIKPIQVANKHKPGFDCPTMDDAIEVDSQNINHGLGIFTLAVEMATNTIWRELLEAVAFVNGFMWATSELEVTSQHLKT